MTLLEVVVAMAVFLIALAGITQLIEYGTTSAFEASRIATAARLCHSKVAEVEAGVVSCSSSSSGTFDEETSWQWSVDIGDTVAPNTYTVTVKVWSEQGGRVETTLTQIIFDPQFMGNAAPAVAPTTTQGP